MHPEPQVLPADADPDDPMLVPAEETEFAEATENRFDCPECNALQMGYPEECDTCGIPYNW